MAVVNISDGMMSDLNTTREQLSRQLAEGIATDPIGVLPIIIALQKETDEHLREAVRQAALSSSWREIAPRSASQSRLRTSDSGLMPRAWPPR
jgi:hypothetical protein